MSVDQIKEAVSNKNAIIDTKETIKYLRLGNVKLVIVANNCPEDIKSDIEKYAKLAQVEVETFDGTGKQLGIFCGKPFPINTL